MPEKVALDLKRVLLFFDEFLKLVGQFEAKVVEKLYTLLVEVGQPFGFGGDGNQLWQFKIFEENVVVLTGSTGLFFLIEVVFFQAKVMEPALAQFADGHRGCLGVFNRIAGAPDELSIDIMLITDDIPGVPDLLRQDSQPRKIIG